MTGLVACVTDLVYQTRDGMGNSVCDTVLIHVNLFVKYGLAEICLQCVCVCFPVGKSFYINR